MTERSGTSFDSSTRAESTGTPFGDIPLLIQGLASLVETAAVFFVSEDVDAAAITASAGPGIPPGAVDAVRDRVRAWLQEREQGIAEASVTVGLLDWQVVICRVDTASGDRRGAIAMVRPGEGAVWWTTEEISALNTFARLCATWAGRGVVDVSNQPRLDALVTRVAVQLMSVSASELAECQEWALRVLCEFFEVDTSFLRRNDFNRQITVLVAEWPRRENVPVPDPLGEVAFGVDPVFDATRDLKEPFVMRPTESPGTYQDRIEQGSGIDQVSMAMVPLLRAGATVGVLGFVKFGDRPWETAETNALQAVASLMVQLEARVDAEERLVYQANHDELTDLPNRRALLDELARRLSHGDGQTTGLIFLDLDRFKAMNDFLGHSGGDRLLTTIAERLRGAMRVGDFVARLAGDEFVFLVESPTGEEAMLAVADKLLKLVAKPIAIAGHQLTRTASLGIAISSKSATNEDLLEQADAALLTAKAKGGNQAVMFDEALRTLTKEESDTEVLLRDAIERGGLLLYYQPEVNLRTGQLLAVEALVRWNHPHRGLLPAGSFIKVAEDTGLVVDLGRWVLIEACRQMAEWRQQYPQLRFTMRVNMSPAQLVTRDLVHIVDDCLRRNDLPGRLLCLEITEHAVMQDVKQALKVLGELKALGVSLAIDDFGTGYSSMSQLKRLPVDALKVDQTFVAGLGVDAGDRAIVDATIRLAQSFGLEVIAEGVETVELVQELLNLGCYRAQGFLLCRPKAAADLVPVLLHGGVDASTFVKHIPVAASHQHESGPAWPDGPGYPSEPGPTYRRSTRSS